MRNLQRETLKAITDCGMTIKDIDYCNIYSFKWYSKDESKDICVNTFNIEPLDFNYNDGYGSQEIFGFIVFKDKSWLARREYDGSEWWEYFKTPERIVIEPTDTGCEEYY